jgi:hypothetical protein
MLVEVLESESGIRDAITADELQAIRTEASALAAELAGVQHANGGWSYYVARSVGGSDAGAAMSFTTATVLLALEQANQSGIEIPQTVLQRGYDCLRGMRGSNGNFCYMKIGSGSDPGNVNPAESAARGPVCALALIRGGRLESAAIQHALETYIEHLAPFGAEARKALMHAGPASQGSHYLLYDYSTAAQAIRRAANETLDVATRNAARAAILQQLARCRNANGSFVDNPIIGCAAGTGLAVNTLLDLAGDASGQ